MGKFFKQAEEAKGIPDRSVMTNLPKFVSPRTFEYVIQDHRADKAGQHYDFRLGDPITGIGFSWVIRSIPEPGQKVLAVRQADHTLKYFDFEGEIKEGYGKGQVKQHDRGKVEVLKSEPGKITFYKYDGPSVHKFTLVNTGGKNWVLLNHTRTKEMDKYHAIPKPKYKDMSTTYEPQAGDVTTRKVDGAYALTVLRPGKTPVVFGKRTSKKTNLPIEYTPKIPFLLDHPSPKSMGKTILRSEVFAVTPDNKEIPNRELGALLNSSVERSRQMQKERSTPLRLVAHDVYQYKGKRYDKRPIEERLKILKEIAREYPLIEDISTAEKKYVLPEGYVVWRNNKPIKVKHKKDYDVYIKEIFTDKTGKKAGGVRYSLTPNGPIVGNVGTGWTHAELREMRENPNRFIGRVAKIYAQEQHPSGALRAPSFNTWHLEKYAKLKLKENETLRRFKKIVNKVKSDRKKYSDPKRFQVDQK